MTDDELDDLLAELEAGIAEDVQAALTLTASEFATAVAESTELVAAAFSVSRIRAMWTRRVPRLLDRLRSLANRSARQTAEDLGDPVPAVDDLTGPLEPYEEATGALLRAVGDRLAAQAAQALAEGLGAGESLSELKSRLTALFNQEGPELGPTRAERIASTETTRAWNAGALAAAQLLTGPDRPLVKQWVTRRDERVRTAHSDADGQLQLLDDPFQVGGIEMQYPGDPSAPADLTIHCRCMMRTATAPTNRTASVDPTELVAAAEHTGAMIALLPTAEDAERLAVPGGEAADQLHTTLMYLGEGADWTEEARNRIRNVVTQSVADFGPIDANAFGVALWNPTSDDPAWVYNIGAVAGSEALTDLREDVADEVDDLGIDLPDQYHPWAAHIAAIYSDGDHREELISRTGPLVFDRVRVAFGGEYTDIPLTGTGRVHQDPEDDDESTSGDDVEQPTASWHTPEGTALAFENQQTGDGRVFVPGALTWNGNGPWPLQFADEMQGGHEGARLAGAIAAMERVDERISGHGVLYLTTSAGYEAHELLKRGAPLGVSVDLDDVDLEVTLPDEASSFRTRLAAASVMRAEDGGWTISGRTEGRITAAATGVAVVSQNVSFTVAPDGTVPSQLATLVAAAGDPDVAGEVVDLQRAGDVVMRITHGRVRGATLVAIPAFANARIVLDQADAATASATGDVDPATDVADDAATASAATTDYERVLRYARRSVAPVTAAGAARFLRIPVEAARRHLARAAQKGDLIRMSRGVYASATEKISASAAGITELVASVTGEVELPVASRETEWDGPAAARRVLAWADGDGERASRAFAYQEDGTDGTAASHFKLGYADVVDGVLTIIPRGVSAALGALHGARGGVDIPQDQREEVAELLEEVAAHVAEETGEDEMDDMSASAWKAMSQLPPMPAEWFREPTTEELPPGGPGVNYSNGRIFGWVAQAGEPHAGFAKKITIDSLGRIDTTHFLRQKFTLDDGSTVKAGAYTMNVGHHRDGAECETSACQFDDTRTVAGIVTVGMNERGMWFSGAAAPWLSEWDRKIFAATQPSYHMKKGPGGNWQLRAVLGVPVPGHSSPLLASAVLERSQMALTAAADMAELDEALSAADRVDEALSAANKPCAEHPDAPQIAGACGKCTLVPTTVEQVAPIDYDRLADSLVAAMARAEEKKAAQAAEIAEMLALADKLSGERTSDERD